MEMGWGTWFGRSQITPLITAIIYSHQQVSKVTVTQLTPPAHFGFLGAESHTKEQGQGTNRAKAQTSTCNKEKSISLHELVYCYKLIWRSIGSDSALAGTQVTQRSWKGSWGRRLLTSRALKTQPFPELYCHLPAAGSFPKAEPGEETKCSSASVPNQLNLVKSPSVAVWAKHTDLTLKQENLPRAHPTRWHAALNSPGAPSPCVTPGILQAWTQQPSLCDPNIPALLSPS